MRQVHYNIAKEIVNILLESLPIVEKIPEIATKMA